jgi:hypothetical protein
MSLVLESCCGSHMISIIVRHYPTKILELLHIFDRNVAHGEDCLSCNPLESRMILSLLISLRRILTIVFTPMILRVRHQAKQAASLTLWELAFFGYSHRCFEARLCRTKRYRAYQSPPTSPPTSPPNSSPSSSPTCVPSSSPNSGPSASPSARPSTSPSGGPSSYPSAVPSAAPSGSPSGSPSVGQLYSIPS